MRFFMNFNTVGSNGLSFITHPHHTQAQQQQWALGANSLSGAFVCSVPCCYLRERLIIILSTYQNRSATDAKSSSEAATCCSGE